MASPRPFHRSQRLRREWALRGALAVVALALGYVSMTRTAAFAVHRSNAERAYALSPHDGRIAARLVERLSLVDPAQRARAERIAREALDDEPLAVPALSVLGLTTQLRGNTDHARKLFAHSNILSRRELGTRLWLIEDAVGRGDISGALHHYDIALRTARTASELLFPVLTVAISDPAIRGAMVDTLAARPPWSFGFINHLANSSVTPNATADLFVRLVQRGVSIPPELQSVVVNALVDSGALKEAWSFYQSLRPGADRRRSRDSRFTARLDAPSLFDWMPVTTDTGVAASIQANREGGLFDFATPSTVGGIVLQQFQLLPPGRYRLHGRSIGIEQASSALPYWQLVCRDGRELGQVDLPRSTENNGRFTGDLTVDGACSVQVLRLVVRPSSEISGVTGQLKSVALVPVTDPVAGGR